MCTVAISIPDEALFDEGMTMGDATDLARQMTAVGLYARRNVSLGYRSDIARIPKADFVKTSAASASPYSTTTRGSSTRSWPMRRDVSNSMPLIVLGNIGRPGLLGNVYREVVIPEAVSREVLAKSTNADLVSRRMKSSYQSHKS